MALALDGSNSAFGSGSSVGAALTTANAGDVIIVYAWATVASAGAISVNSVTGGGLTFVKRAVANVVQTSNNSTQHLEEWWAVAPSALSAVTITVNFSASSPSSNSIWVFGVSGCPTPNNPWDQNSSLPSIVQVAAATATPPVISTSSANDMLLNADICGVASPGPGSGWTQISAISSSFDLTQYDVVSATQSNLTIPVGSGVSGTITVAIGDALTANNPPLFSDLTLGNLQPVRRVFSPLFGQAASSSPPPVRYPFWYPKQIVITSGTTWTVPSDWNSNANTIDAVGGGGGNGQAQQQSFAGGCYARIVNFSATPGASIAIQIGTGGGTTGSGSASANTTFNSTSTLVAAGGASVTTNCVGSIVYAGGAAAGVGSGAGGGGGGAAGPYGPGSAGAAGGASNGAQGANSDAGYGGTGGTGGVGATGGQGNPGAEWGSTGVGSGGGGGGGAVSHVGGAGGLYGGAAGGAGSGSVAGVGANGLIVITYLPLLFLISEQPPDPLPNWLGRVQAVSKVARDAQIANPVAPFVPPIPVVPAWHQPFRDPVRRAVPPPWGEKSPGIEARYVYVSPYPYFFVPPLDPIRRVPTPSPVGMSPGIELPYVYAPATAPVYGWFMPLSQPVLRKPDNANYPTGYNPPDVYVYHTPPTPTYRQIPFIFPIPLFFFDLPPVDACDWINFLILELNGAMLAQNWSCGDPGSCTLYKFVTALNNGGNWSAVYTSLSGTSITNAAVLQYTAGAVVRQNDSLYNFVQGVLGFTHAQMVSLFATANALKNP